MKPTPLTAKLNYRTHQFNARWVSLSVLLLKLTEERFFGRPPVPFAFLRQFRRNRHATFFCSILKMQMVLSWRNAINKFGLPQRLFGWQDVFVALEDAPPVKHLLIGTKEPAPDENPGSVLYFRTLEKGKQPVVSRALDCRGKSKGEAKSKKGTFPFGKMPSRNVLCLRRFT